MRHATGPLGLGGRIGPPHRGWQVPAYTFPASRQDLAVLRIVVRNGFSHDLAALFIADLERLLPELERQAEPIAKELATSFRH